MGQPDQSNSNFDVPPASSKKRRVRQRKWDNPIDSAPLTELKAKTAEEELKKRARRLYIGNLPTGVKLQDVVDFFNGALIAMTDDPTVSINNYPVWKTEIYNQEQAYCFLEFRTSELADLCFKLDGIICNGNSLKIRRPIDSTNNITTDDTKIFIQNIPLEKTEDDIKELLEQYGKLRVINLVRDINTNLNKGYGFFEYENSNSAKLAVTNLNGYAYNNNVLSVKHAAFGYFASGGKPVDCKASNLPNSITQSLLSNPLLGLQMQSGRKIGSKPSRVVQLLNIVFHEDIINDNNYNELLNIIKKEAEKYGPLEEIIIPKPDDNITYKEGVGKVFLKFSNETAGRKAQYMLNGRVFDKNRVVCAAFYPLDKFLQGKYTLI